MIAERVLLNSGGMDTFLLAHYLDCLPEKPTHVFVDVGQAYAQKEFRSAGRVAAHFNHNIHFMSGAKIGRFEVGDTGIIPFRNAELILCAAQFGNVIYMGVIGHEVNSDKSCEFLQAMQQVLNISHRQQYWTPGRHLNIMTPLRGKTKAQLVREYLALGGDRLALLRTVSCYDAGHLHCGKCPSCFKRWVALENNDLRQEWAADPWLQVDFVKLAEKMEAWHVLRQSEVKLAFNKVGVHL